MKSKFVDMFGESTEVKLIDFLFNNVDFDFTLTQMQNGIGMSRTSIRPVIKCLIDRNLVKVSRTDTKSNYYRINKDSVKFELLQKINVIINKEEKE